MKRQKVLKCFSVFWTFFANISPTEVKDFVEFFSNMLWIFDNGFINFDFLGEEI